MRIKWLVSRLIFVDGYPSFVNVIAVVASVVEEAWPVGVTQSLVNWSLWVVWVAGHTEYVVSSSRVTVHGERMRMIGSYDYQRFFQLNLP